MKEAHIKCLLCHHNLGSTNSEIHSKLSLTTKSSKRKSSLKAKSIEKFHIEISFNFLSFVNSLCYDCINYFDVIKNNLPSSLFITLSKLPHSMFTSMPLQGMGLIKYQSVNSKTIYLFTYFLFWLCSIDKYGIYKDFKIDDYLEEELRNILISYKNVNEVDYYRSLQLFPETPILPIVVLKTISDYSCDGNEYSNYYSDPFHIKKEKISFILFRSCDEMKKYFIRHFVSLNTNEFSSMIVSNNLYHDTISKSPFGLLID